MSGAPRPGWGHADITQTGDRVSKMRRLRRQEQQRNPRDGEYHERAPRDPVCPAPPEAAGIGPGDLLATFDGVRVATQGDVVPVTGEREATVVLRRAEGTSEVTRTLAVDGFLRAPPADLVAAALIALSALALVLVLGAPARPLLAASLQREISRMRAGLVPAFRSAVRDALPPAGALALVDACGYALLAAMPFGQYLVAAQLDVGILFVAAATAVSAAAVVAGVAGVVDAASEFSTRVLRPLAAALCCLARERISSFSCFNEAPCGVFA